MPLPNHELLRVRNIGDDTAEKISNWEKSVDLAGELKRIADFGCHVLISSDENYPASLREIYDPPLVLYVKGELTAKDKNAVAMVGSRMTTHYGIETARKLAYQLAYIGVTVVSGGARGIDTAAHQGALSGKGRTIAVLGTGINLICAAGERGIVRAHRGQRRGHHAVSLQPPGGQAKFSHPQPHRRRHDSGHGGRRGQPDQRRAHHGEFCDGIWPADFRGAGPD